MSEPSPTLALDLRYARYEIWAERKTVATVFPDGHACFGTREDNPQNRREAEAQGYSGPLAVWRSLVEHELLHSLVAEIIFDRPSVVMLTESGAGFTPTWLRYEEEMLALSLQRLFNTGEIPDPLKRYGLRGLPEIWNLTYAPLLEPLWR